MGKNENIVYKPIVINERIPFGKYEISEYGDVYSIKKDITLSTKKDKDGYETVGLSNSGKRYWYRISTLVIKAFIGDPPKNMKDPTVDHIDSNKNNNHYSNLRWLERGINSSIRKNKGIGELNPSAVLSDNDVIKICQLLQDTDMSYAKIGKMFDVDISTINNIAQRKNWEHISQCYSFDKRLDLKSANDEYLKLNNNSIMPKNKTKNGLYNYQDKTLTIKQISNLCGINYSTLLQRLKHGWSMEDATLIPPKAGNNQSTLLKLRSGMKLNKELSNGNG